MSTAGGISPEVHERILDAALVELADRGIDKFRVDRVARRAGVETPAIFANWRDWRVLLRDALLTRADEMCPTPDTGGLHEDLEALAGAMSEISGDDLARRLVHRVLPAARDTDSTHVGVDFWNARMQAAEPIIQRAADRGELRDGIDPADAVRMLGSALYYDVIFHGTPTRSGYADQVIDIFLHGAQGNAGMDRPWSEISSAGDDSAAPQRIAAARRAVTLLQAWVDALPDPMVLWEAVRNDSGRVVDFRYRDLNRAACEELDRSRAELLGRHVFEVLPELASSGLPDHYAACLDSGEPVVLDDVAFTYFGETRRLDIRAARAGFDLLTVSWRDVGDRAESIRRLSESESWLRLVAENSADVLTHVRDGVITWASPSSEADHWVGQPVIQLIAVEDHPVAAEVLIRLEGGAKELFRGRVKGLVGTMHWADVHAKIFYDEAGEPDGYMASFRTVDREFSTERPSAR